MKGEGFETQKIGWNVVNEKNTLSEWWDEQDFGVILDLRSPHLAVEGVTLKPLGILHNRSWLGAVFSDVQVHKE